MLWRSTPQLIIAMKTFVITLVALAAYVEAVPAPKSTYIDIYRNIIKAPSARIVGGEDAERHQFPYQAAIRWRYSSSGSGVHLCGGTLITDNWVLTAAHCKAYNFGEYQVVLGQLVQEEDHPDIQVFNAVQFIVHPQYAGTVAPYDIALIELDRKVTITDAVQIAKLGEQQHCDAIEKTLLSGWGLIRTGVAAPNHLQWANLPRITNEQCAEDLVSVLGFSEPLDETMICIGSSAGSEVHQTACNGDSGGPLVLASSNALVGVVSWGVTPCGIPPAPSVFTRVCSFFDFIAEHIPDIIFT